MAAGGLSQAPPSSEGRRYGQEELRRAWKAQHTAECRRAGVAWGKGGGRGGRLAVLAAGVVQDDERKGLEAGKSEDT